jgi:hypothetical protein
MKTVHIVEDYDPTLLELTDEYGRYLPAIVLDLDDWEDYNEVMNRFWAWQSRIAEMRKEAA